MDNMLGADSLLLSVIQLSSSQFAKKLSLAVIDSIRIGAKTSRSIEHGKVAPGDIVVVYSSKRALQGDHITLCIDNSTVNEGYITTIEGNAHGTLGDGEYGEGVIKRQRKFSEFAHVYQIAWRRLQ